MLKVLLAFMLFSGVAAAQTRLPFSSGPAASGGGGLVIPAFANVSPNWQVAGLTSIGGIPSRSACATLNPIGGGTSDATNIKNAIAACPAGQAVVLGSTCLPTCVFSVHGADLPFVITTGITIRGGGTCPRNTVPYCQVSIVVTDGLQQYTGGTCTASCSGFPLFFLAPSSVFDQGWAQCGLQTTGLSCGAVALTADAAQGDTVLHVASTTGFVANDWLLIDEASNAGFVSNPMNSFVPCGNIWATSDWTASPTPATGRFAWSKFASPSSGGGSCNGDFGTSDFPTALGTFGCVYGFCDRPVAEIHRIASVGAGTITLTSPLTIAFRISGGHNAQIYAGPFNQAGNTHVGMLQQAGIENLSTQRTSSGAIQMTMCAYCWVKNVEVSQWYGGAVTIAYGWRNEINTITVDNIWNSVNSGGEYPIALDTASTEILLTNSIITIAGKGMVSRGGGAGSVISYNYQDMTMYDSFSGIGDYFVDMGINASHAIASHHILLEGNWGDNCDGDHTHGANMYMTFYRNQCAGLRSDFTDPSIPAGGTISDFSGVAYACGTSGPGGCSHNSPGPFRATGPQAFNYWYTFTGNVLGLAGKTTTGNGWRYTGDWTQSTILMLGWNDGPGGQDPNLNGVSNSFVTVHQNYDYVTAGIHAGLNNGGFTTTLPNSMYLSSTPSFFGPGASCTYTWPWIDPAATPPVKTNSCANSGLPAKARFDAGTPFVQP